MFILKLAGKLIKALKSEDSPNQMAWGFALGTFLGLIPVNTLFTVVILFILCIFRVNFASAMLAFAFYSLFAYLIDPVFHQIGFFLLVKVGFLKSLWVMLYNLPVAPLTRFNNTIVSGSLLISLLLFVPHYLLFRDFVVRYRTSWNVKIAQWKLVKILKGSKLVQLYTKIKAMGA
jgi:uncharacterized protein (TIGR03546 family)